LCVWGAGDAKFFPGLSLWAGVYLFAWAWVGVFLLSAVLAWVFNRLNSKYVRLCLVPFSLVAFWLMGVAKALGVFGP
jgi:Flp pilus assembly protein protease CpaA